MHVALHAVVRGVELRHLDFLPHPGLLFVGVGKKRNRVAVAQGLVGGARRFVRDFHLASGRPHEGTRDRVVVERVVIEAAFVAVERVEFFPLGVLSVGHQLLPPGANC